MKHLICTATGKVEIAEVPVPEIAEGELLIAMEACGICGTDVMKVFDPSVAKPVQLGHEVVGKVVKGNRELLGKQVAVAHHAPDFASHYALRGSETQDPTFKASNIDPGGFAEFIRVPAALVQHTVVVVPEGVPTQRAAMMEPLACCLRALDRAYVQKGDTVLVIGVGAIGILFVPLLISLGVAVMAVDVKQQRLEEAKKWGAFAAHSFGDAETIVTACEKTDGRGVDLVIVTITNDHTLELALNAVRDGGTIIPFGVKPGSKPALDLWQTYRREINVTASYSATPEGLHRAMRLLTEPGFELEKTISHRLPLAEAPKAFELLHRGDTSKVLIEAG